MTRQIGRSDAKRKRMLFSRTELRKKSDIVNGASDRQMLGAKRKRMSFSRTVEEQTYE